MSRDWKAVLDAERGEKAPEGWAWFIGDGWGRGLLPDEGGWFVFPSSPYARTLPVVRVCTSADREPGDVWTWTVLAWFDVDRNPEVFDSAYRDIIEGGWEDVAEGESVYALDAIAASEEAIEGDGWKALVAAHVESCKTPMVIDDDDGPVFR